MEYKYVCLKLGFGQGPCLLVRSVLLVNSCDYEISSHRPSTSAMAWLYVMNVQKERYPETQQEVHRTKEWICRTGFSKGLLKQRRIGTVKQSKYYYPRNK